MPPVAVVVLAVVAFAAIALLINNADAARRAQLRTTSVTLALTDLQAAPFNADPTAGGSPAQSRRQIKADERTIARGLSSGSQAGVPAAVLALGRRRLSKTEPVVMESIGSRSAAPA